MRSHEKHEIAMVLLTDESLGKRIEANGYLISNQYEGCEREVKLSAPSL